jgi:hypothetical protein
MPPKARDLVKRLSAAELPSLAQPSRDRSRAPVASLPLPYGRGSATLSRTRGVFFLPDPSAGESTTIRHLREETPHAA